MHRFLIERQASVEIDVDQEADLDVLGHKLQLEQAFSILLTNACYAVGQRFSDDPLQGRITISVTTEDDAFQIRFADNGTGMEAHVLKNIFVPYYTTKPQGIGEGLGLPICQAIFNRHGGQISVNSALNQGTTFTIKLPKAGEGSDNG